MDLIKLGLECLSVSLLAIDLVLVYIFLSRKWKGVD